MIAIHANPFGGTAGSDQSFTAVLIEAIEAILTCRLGYMNSSRLRLVEAGSDARVPREGVNPIGRSGKKINQISEMDMYVHTYL